jgi:hypothetical protein
MTRYCAVNLRLRRAGRKLELTVEGVQLKNVAVWPMAWGWTGAAPPHRAEVPPALERRHLTFDEASPGRVDTPGPPMREGAAGASGSSTTNANDAVPCGTPLQASGGETSSPSCVLARDRPTVLERRARQLELVHVDLVPASAKAKA